MSRSSPFNYSIVRCSKCNTTAAPIYSKKKKSKLERVADALDTSLIGSILSIGDTHFFSSKTWRCSTCYSTNITIIDLIKKK